ncbi:MAG TPA: subclass B3 metallo-beta-lactamase [Gammaproteobacteria bacterium]|nr:subclass B3 metallo-beta-lactamase [Gammaproteobacteria bacterium]
MQPELNKPQTPFKIIGDVYYVGTNDLGIYLITTSKGSILLDSGFAETVPQVRANITALGFKLQDVKILLTSQTHYDHVGGMAEMKRLTHARLEATGAGAEQMAAGGRDDYGFYERFMYEPVQTDRVLADGDQVELGGITLTAHLTPGHTKGCTTWTMTVEDDGKPYHVVFLCGVTVPGYKLVDNPGYPDIVSDYERSFAVLRGLPCDVFLGAHGQYFGLQAKLVRLHAHAATNPFIDPAGYRAYLDQSERDFLGLVAQQRSAAAAVPH